MRNILALTLLLTMMNLASATLAQPEETKAEPTTETQAETQSPTEVVVELQAAIIACMQSGKTVDIETRIETLRPVVVKTHDFPSVGKIVLGRAFDGLSTEEKKEFIKAFAELSLAMYASNFSNFTDELFEIEKEEEMDRGNVLVRSWLWRKGAGEKIQFDYVLANRGERWKIINIIVDGVSDLALKRAEYSEVMKNEGFDPLIALIKQKTDEELEPKAE